MLDLKFSKPSRRFLNKLKDDDWQRLIDKIESMRTNPFPSNVKRVEGRKDKTFRVRVGQYRIIYLVYRNRKLLFISDIDKRSRVYD